MTTNSSLRLLQLPWLTLVKAIRMIDARELYKLSTLSKRSRTAVWRSSYGMTIVFGLGFYKDGAVGFVGNLLDGIWYRFAIEPSNGLSYASVAQCKHLISRVAETFKTVQIRFENQVPAMKAPLIREFIPLAKRLGMTLDKVIAHSCGIDDELCGPTLEACGTARQLDFYWETTPEAQIALDVSLEIKSVNIWECYAVKVDHLVKNFWNCEKIEIASGNFSALELNSFLKHWMKGGSKIEVFEYIPEPIVYESIFEDEIMNGIRFRRVIPTEIGLLNGVYNRLNCLLLENDGGVSAVVCLGKKGFGLTTDYKMQNERALVVEPVRMNDNFDFDFKFFGLDF